MKIGRAMGVEIHLNVFFIALLGLYFVAGILERGLIVFGVVLLHEWAHAIAARWEQVEVTSVELLPFGGVARVAADLVLDPKKEALVAMAGPAANLILIGLALGLKNYGLWDNHLGPFFLQSNLILALFNLLPALPLDGGRVLRAWLACRSGAAKATYITAWLGQAAAVVIAILGLLGICLHFNGLDIVFTALFVFYAATKEKAMAPFLFVRHLHRKQEELANFGLLPAEQLVVLDNVPLQRVMQQFVPRRFHLIYLLDKNFSFRGMLTECQVLTAILEQGVDMTAGDLLDLKK